MTMVISLLPSYSSYETAFFSQDDTRGKEVVDVKAKSRKIAFSIDEGAEKEEMRNAILGWCWLAFLGDYILRLFLVSQSLHDMTWLDGLTLWANCESL